MSFAHRIVARSSSGCAVLLFLASTAFAGSSCPDNLIGVSRTDVGFVTSAATASVIWTEGPGDQVVPWNAAQPCPEGCYDLPNGTLVALGSNYLYGLGGTFVRVGDEYVVVGPSGPALSFEVVLQLNATIESEGTASAEIRADLQSSSAPSLQLTATGTAETSLPIVAAPGTPFQVSAWASAVGGHYEGSGTAVAKIRFRGLPSAYRVASCQGFNLPTPSHSTTWGGVKAHYR